MLNYDDRPIIACSSGNVRCAISLIRISGENYLSSLQNYFSIDLDKITPRVATFCKVIDEDRELDEVVLTYFKAPQSYNGEDVLEISVHGNPVNIARIIKLLKHGTELRDSHPGEFSLRAMNNGKLSLTQVEGLDLLLNANSVLTIDQGLSVLSGNLHDKFLHLHKAFLNHRSCLEFGFDFLEDIGEEQFKERFSASLELLKSSIKNLHAHCLNSPFNLLKPEIALVGLPNAGKSSLFNILLDTDRSIVTDIPGTTRDFVSEDFYINDSLYTLVDTAGIRDTSDIVEKEGVTRSLKVLSSAFFKILVVNPANIDVDFYANFSETQFDLIIFSHQDENDFDKNILSNGISILKELGPMEPLDFGPIEPLDFGPIEPVDFGPIEPLIQRSVGMSFVDANSATKELISDQIHLKYTKLMDFDPILIQRHVESINKIHSNFTSYLDLIKDIEDISIIASELNILGHCISELIGIVSPDDVLHNIFDNFCIGK